MKKITEVAMGNFPVKIARTDKVLVLGSCFAANIGARMQEEGYDVCVNPFGTLFNPASVASSIRRLASGKPFTEEECVQMGAGSNLWCSFSHYTKFARPTREEFLHDANEALAQASAFFRDCNKVIVTFGTSYVFEHLGFTGASGVFEHTGFTGASGSSGASDVLRTSLQPAGRIVSNCLKRDAREFRRYRMSIEEIVSLWRPLLAGPDSSDPASGLLESGLASDALCSDPTSGALCSDPASGCLAGKDVIFTVSPIRHMADTAHGNQLSKSTLLLAIDTLLTSGASPAVASPDTLGASGATGAAPVVAAERAYFPSYEIVLDELRDYSWYAEDSVHPSADAVTQICDRFLRATSK